jgi:hypothetical protein
VVNKERQDTDMCYGQNKEYTQQLYSATFRYFTKSHTFLFIFVNSVYGQNNK